MSDCVASSAYLEGTIAEAFMHMAINEGFAEYDYLDGIMEDILARYRKSRMRQKALTSALLYDHLHIVEFWDSFNFKDLAAEGIVSVSEPAQSSARSNTGSWPRGVTLFTDEQIDTLLTIRSAILPYLRRRHRISAKVFDSMIDKIIDPNFLWKESEKVKKIGSDYLLFSPIIPIVGILENDILPIVDLLHTVSLNKSAIETTKIRAPYLSLKSTTQGISSKYAYNAYAIVIEEIEAFPKPRTLAEAIDLRNDRRIRDFRSVLWRWAKTLQQENVSGEKKLRKELQSAAKSMKSFPITRNISCLITYISLPMALVPYIGLPITALGFAIQAVTDIKVKKLQWLMINL